MTKGSGSKGRAALAPKRGKDQGRPRLPQSGVLNKPPSAFAAPGGTSLFSASRDATPDQLARTIKVMGGILGPDTFVEFYRLTKNPAWLWVSLAFIKNKDEMPAVLFSYLQNAGKEFFAGIEQQMTARDVLQMIEGATLEEGIIRQKERLPIPPNVADVLGLSHPSRNLFRAAAQDLRALSIAVATEDHREQGYRLEDIYEFLAKATGRVSPEAGPSIAQVKQTATRGKKLLAAAHRARNPSTK